MKGHGRIELEPCGPFGTLCPRMAMNRKSSKVLAADSVTRLYGIVYLPFDRKPGKYPDHQQCLSGPHVDLVPQAFLDPTTTINRSHSWDSSS